MPGGRDGERPVVVVIGGPNGAGKTTTAYKLLPGSLGMARFVNADQIAVGLNAFAPDEVALQAGRLMLARLDELARQRQDFAFETTLAAPTLARRLRQLQESGYRVEIVYVCVRTPDTAVLRVAERVKHGGHHVPEDVVRRRYSRSLINFFDVYQALADSWVLCDNSGDSGVIVARGERENVREILDEGRYDEIRRAVERERAKGVAD